MLVSHKNNGYSWGELGKVYYGSHAQSHALSDGVNLLGIAEFRKQATISYVIPYLIEVAVAEFRANTRDGMKGDYMDEDEEDINNGGSAVAYISQEERNKIASDDFGWPAEHKYPIRNQSDLDAAARLIGRAPADMQDSIKRRIKEIARRKHLQLPDSWVNE